MLQCVLAWGPETDRPVIAMQHSIQNVAICLGMGTGYLQTSSFNATFNSKCCNVSWHGDRRPTDQWLQCRIQFKILQCVLPWRPETYRQVIVMQCSIKLKMLQCVLTWGPETYRPVIAMQHSIQNVVMCLGMGTGDRQTSHCNATVNSKCCNVSWHGDRGPTDQAFV
jgi:hypothetical protein